MAFTGAFGAGSEMALARGGSATSAITGAAAAAGAEALAARGATLPPIASGATLVFAVGAVDSSVPTSGRRGVFSPPKAAGGRRETGRGTAETLPLPAVGAVAARAIAKAPAPTGAALPFAAPALGGGAGTEVTGGIAEAGELALAESAIGEATDFADAFPPPEAAMLARGGDDVTAGDDAIAGDADEPVTPTTAAGAVLGEGGGAECAPDGGFDA